MEELVKIPWYEGMKVRWMRQKPHRRTRVVGLRRGKTVDVETTFVAYREVFTPSEQEYNGIYDLVEVVGASLHVEAEPPLAPVITEGTNEGAETAA